MTPNFGSLSYQNGERVIFPIHDFERFLNIVAIWSNDISESHRFCAVVIQDKYLLEPVYSEKSFEFVTDHRSLQIFFLNSQTHINVPLEDVIRMLQSTSRCIQNTPKNAVGWEFSNDLLHVIHFDYMQGGSPN